MVHPDVEAAAVVRVAAREQIQVGIDRQVVVVARAARIDLEVAAVWAHADVAAAPQLNLVPVGAGGLHESIVADGDVEPAVDSNLDAVGRVIGAAEVQPESQSANERAPIVGDTVAVGVAQSRDERRVRHVQGLAVERGAARTVERREHRVFIGLTIAVLVDEPRDVAHAGIRLQRAIAIDADEDHAVVGRGDARRVVDDRRRRKHADREAGCGLHRGEDRAGGFRTDRQSTPRGRQRRRRGLRGSLLRGGHVRGGDRDEERRSEKDTAEIHGISLQCRTSKPTCSDGYSTGESRPKPAWRLRFDQTRL